MVEAKTQLLWLETTTRRQNSVEIEAYLKPNICSPTCSPFLFYLVAIPPSDHLVTVCITLNFLWNHQNPVNFCEPKAQVALLPSSPTTITQTVTVLPGNQGICFWYVTILKRDST
jgi:hypothetical protein